MKLACGQYEQSHFPADGLIKLGGGKEHADPFRPKQLANFLPL